MECPNIIRVLCTPLNSTAQAQIVATDLLSLAVMALLGQQSRKRQRTSVSGSIIVTTFKIGGNHRYIWTKNQRSLFCEPSPALQLSAQDYQLMSENRILRLKPVLRLKGRDQHGQSKADKCDHRANLADSIIQ